MKKVFQKRLMLWMTVVSCIIAVLTLPFTVFADKESETNTGGIGTGKGDVVVGDQFSGNNNSVVQGSVEGDYTTGSNSPIIKGDTIHYTESPGYKEIYYLHGGVDDGIISMASTPSQTTYELALKHAISLLGDLDKSEDPLPALQELLGSSLGTNEKNDSSSGFSTLLPAGTEVELLNETSGSGLGAVTKVKILSGGDIGKEGWVSTQVIKIKRVPK